MTDFSDELAAIALELLTEYGQAISFERVTPGTYDPATATAVAGTPSTWTGYGQPSQYDNMLIDGERIKQGDILLTVNAVSTEPIPGDEVTVNTIKYKVLSVTKHVTNGIAVAYELQIRI